MEGDQPQDVERRSLWQGFLLDAGASSDRNPVELFGSPIVDRIFVGTNSWHWRRLAWPALVAFGILLSGLCLNTWRSSDNILLALFSGALGLLCLMGAWHLWNDHRVLPASTPHALATDPEQHRWLDRLHGYLARVIRGEVEVYSGNAEEALDGQFFAHNDGRILVLDSCYGRTDRARRYRRTWFRYVTIEPPQVAAKLSSVAGAVARSDEPTAAGAEATNVTSAHSVGDQASHFGSVTSAPAMAAMTQAKFDFAPPHTHELQAPATVSPRGQTHHLHGLKKREFNQILKAYLASKDWDKDRMAAFIATQRAAFDLVRDDPHPHQGQLIQKVRERALETYGTRLPLSDDSISKQIGNSDTHKNSEFRRFVIDWRLRQQQRSADPQSGFLV